MKIKIIGLRSDETKEYIVKDLERKITENISGFEIVEGEEFDIPIFVVATGGVEGQFKKIYRKYSSPYIIIYNEFNNSLPASLEILSFLREEGLKGVLIDLKDVSKERIERIFPLSGERIGLIGRPSDWLIASTYPVEFYKERFDIDVIYVPIEEAIENFKHIDEEKAANLAGKLLSNAQNVFDVDLVETKKAFKFYLSLKEIVEKYRLNHVSVRCFDIIKPLDTTGCIALSALNDEGVIAGCEGDLPSTISMILLKKISHKTPFMANVSGIEEKDSRLFVTFAHCTIGLTIVKNYNLRTHFETDKGVGIQGFFEHGPVTVVRVGGKNLDEGFVMAGEEIGVEFSASRCRTQLRVELPYNAKDYFLREPLGNHHIIVRGNYKNKVIEAFHLLDIKEV